MRRAAGESGSCCRGGATASDSALRLATERVATGRRPCFVARVPLASAASAQHAAITGPARRLTRRLRGGASNVRACWPSILEGAHTFLMSMPFINFVTNLV
jgi:hypothetical protein